MLARYDLAAGAFDHLLPWQHQAAHSVHAILVDRPGPRRECALAHRPSVACASGTQANGWEPEVTAVIGSRQADGPAQGEPVPRSTR